MNEKLFHVTDWLPTLTSLAGIRAITNPCLTMLSFVEASPPAAPHPNYHLTTTLTLALSLVLGIDITRAPNLPLDGSDIWLVIKMLGSDWLSRGMLPCRWLGLSMFKRMMMHYRWLSGRR